MTKHDHLPTVAEHREFGREVKAFELALGRMTTGTPEGLGFWRFGKSSRQAKAFMRVHDAPGHTEERNGQWHLCSLADER
jgi:hypothetical protein